MKLLFVLCLIISAAVAFPTFGRAPAQPSRASPPAVSRSGPSATGRGPAVPARNAQPNYGPKAYGPGLNNPYAFPPNPFKMQRALALANKATGILVRVGRNGEVEITDNYGDEVDGVYDQYGRDLTELYDL